MERKVRQEALYIKEYEAEQVAFGGKMSVVYKITKRIWGNNTTQSAPVRYRNGYGLTTERKQATRWVQHFQELLNRPEPGGPASPPQAEDVLEININPATEAEVRAAIKAMKSGFWHWFHPRWDAESRHWYIYKTSDWPLHNHLGQG